MKSERVWGVGVSKVVGTAKAVSAVKERYLALSSMSLAVLFWGFSFVSTKIVLDVWPPVTIAFLRQVMAVLVLVPWALRTGGFSGVSLRDAGAMGLAGLFGTVLYFTFENTGLKYTTASNASMLTSALPVLTMFAEAVFFKLRVTRRMILSVTASVIGVYLLVTVDGKLDFSSSRLLGNGLVLAAMACWVVYTFLNGITAKRHSSVTCTAYQSVLSLLLFIPLTLPERSAWPALSEVPLAAVLHLVFLGVTCSAIAYFCFVYAVRRLGATLSSAFLNLIPVVTVVASYFVLGERLTWTQFLGMAIVMTGIYALTRVHTVPAASSPDVDTA